MSEAQPPTRQPMPTHVERDRIYLQHPEHPQETLRKITLEEIVKEGSLTDMLLWTQIQTTVIAAHESWAVGQAVRELTGELKAQVARAANPAAALEAMTPQMLAQIAKLVPQFMQHMGPPGAAVPGGPDQTPLAEKIAAENGDGG